MFKKYAHLVTFQEQGATQRMKMVQTRGKYFTVDEWNDFTSNLYGKNENWTVLNVVTMTY